MCSGNTKRAYSTVLNKLFTTKFKVKIRFDLNRVHDAQVLRRWFGEETGNPIDTLDLNGCSVLELMVRVAYECEKIMESANSDQSYWFSVMIHSLGLDDYPDSQYDEDSVNRILDIFMSRKYDSNGKGGLFTIKNNDVDLRKYEIWDQMNEYLCELVFGN